MINSLYAFLIGFVLTAIVDIFWTLYVKATAGHHPLKASSWSACIVGFGLMNTFNFIHNPLYTTIGSAIGAFVGTYVTLRWLTTK